MSAAGKEQSIVEIIENEYIFLQDGVKLAARIWLPANARDHPVPAIFEFLPYRKRDGTATRDEITYQYFATHGYAGVRVDMRGCGDSTGHAQDEYVKSEQDDAVECIEWISKQPWCTGKIGMMGISWGGFNSLQVAARQPEALKAIICICFTDDRYSDDIHYKGGAMLMEKLKWSAYMGMIYSFPPDPLISGENWLEMWVDRLNNLPALSKLWLSHQTRDAYWKQGSVCEDYAKVKIPSFLIGGYLDGYTNTVKRTFDNIEAPKRAILGPWLHLYPHIAMPAPLWGFCTEAVKWWDRWLKDREDPCEPKFITYIQDQVAVPYQPYVDGRWVENPVSEMKPLYFSDEKLGSVKGNSIINICSSQNCGQKGGGYFPYNLDLTPREQSVDDDLSCIFETDPYNSIVDYVGRPQVMLSVASNKKVANIFIRLCIVDEEGNSRCIGFSGGNLNHDNKHETVTLLEPGVVKEIAVDLDIIGETIRPGYKLRLALSTAYFPMFVPNPERTTLSLDVSKCQLNMPVLVRSDPFSEVNPEITDDKPLPTTVRTPSYFNRSSHVDESGLLTVVTTQSTGEIEFLAHGLVKEWKTEVVDAINEDDPSTTQLDVKHESNWSRGEDWKVSIHSSQKFTMDQENFIVHETRVAKHNGMVVFDKDYSYEVKRNGT